MFLQPHSADHFFGHSAQFITRPPSPPVLNVSDGNYLSSCSLGNALPPQVIYKPSDQQVNYKQNIFIRWLKPPTPPPPAPIIVREIQSPPEVLPPLIYRQMAPPPPTPPPIIVREQPPPCPPPCKPVIIEKRLPPATLPRQVVVERCPPPPCKPQTVIYEKYLPQPEPQRQVIVQRESCPPAVCCPPPKPAPCRRLVREIIRQVPQPCPAPQPAMVCTEEQQQQIIEQPPQIQQQFVPVFATRRHIVQPRGIRVIRQVVGPAQASLAHQHQFAQMPSPIGASIVQGLQAGLIR